MLLSDGSVYLDYNATTPIDPRVMEAMDPYLRTHFGNPSSNHPLGRRARQAVEHAREQVATLIGANPREVIFTSSGSESNNMALKGIADLKGRHGQHVVLSSIEHPAITQVGNYLKKQGYRLSYLPVDSQGVVRVEELAEIITSKTILVSVMHANNEIGSLQPISELAAIARRVGAVMHTDAAQSVGKVPVDVNELACDLLSIAGHKLYAPKGVGALFVRSGLKPEPLIHGAGHEYGFRAGTEAVAQIVGLGMAAEIARDELEVSQIRLKQLRDKLQHSLKEAFPDLRINAGATRRLPNTLSVSFPDLNALDIMSDLEGVLLSPGAACHSGESKGSSVLEAMQVPMRYQLGTLRLSLGRFTDDAQIQQSAKLLIQHITKLLSD